MINETASIKAYVEHPSGMAPLDHAHDPVERNNFPAPDPFACTVAPAPAWFGPVTGRPWGNVRGVIFPLGGLVPVAAPPAALVGSKCSLGGNGGGKTENDGELPHGSVV